MPSDHPTISSDRELDCLVGGIFAGYGYRIMPQMMVDEEARFSVGADDAMSAVPLVADETIVRLLG